jgi:hypothetical protein
MKINIKKIGLLLGLGTMALCQSCVDLEPEVYSKMDAEEFNQNPEVFESKLGDVYVNLQREYGYVYREGYWSMQEYTTDEVVIPTRGTDWFDNGVPIAMHQHTWTFNTRDINNGWSFAYGGTAKCNNVLNNIKMIKGEDESLYDEATWAGIAEAKTLRAFYHFLAMDLYGNATIDDGIHEVKQYSRKEIYEFIEAELLAAIPQLTNDVRYGSMTRPVAFALLAKLYLNAEAYCGEAQWAKCAQYCDSIINGGYGYMLDPNYMNVFKTTNTNNPEIIFPIVFDSKYAKGNMFHLITLHYVHQEVYGLTTPPWNGPCTLESFYNKYADNDKRKAQWLVGAVLNEAGDTIMYDTGNKAIGQDGLLPAVITPKVSKIEDPTKANSFEGARFVKFEPEYGIEHHANSDFPIYRYADILLMKAECLMRLNGGTANAEALALINEVHTRAGLEPYATITLDELLDERGRELAWEGHRRQDLIRFDKFANGTWEFKEKTPKHVEIYPIPEWVMTANPGVYTQNNGYE